MSKNVLKHFISITNNWQQDCKNYFVIAQPSEHLSINVYHKLWWAKMHLSITSLSLTTGNSITIWARMYLRFLSSSITTGNSFSIITLSFCSTHLMINAFVHCCYHKLWWAIIYLSIVSLSLMTGNNIAMITLSLCITHLLINIIYICVYHKMGTAQWQSNYCNIIASH